MRLSFNSHPMASIHCLVLQWRRNLASNSHVVLFWKIFSDMHANFTCESRRKTKLGTESVSRFCCWFHATELLVLYNLSTNNNNYNTIIITTDFDDANFSNKVFINSKLNSLCIVDSAVEKLIKLLSIANDASKGCANDKLKHDLSWFIKH